jgi:hypothetical protein
MIGPGGLPLVNYYTLATSIPMILFSQILKFSKKKFFAKEQIFCEGKQKIKLYLYI